MTRNITLRLWSGSSSWRRGDHSSCVHEHLRQSAWGVRRFGGAFVCSGSWTMNWAMGSSWRSDVTDSR